MLGVQAIVTHIQQVGVIDKLHIAELVAAQAAHHGDGKGRMALIQDHGIFNADAVVGQPIAQPAAETAQRKGSTLGIDGPG